MCLYSKYEKYQLPWKIDMLNTMKNRYVKTYVPKYSIDPWLQDLQDL